MITELSQALLVILVFFTTMAAIFGAVIHAESALHRSAPAEPVLVPVTTEREAADRLAA